MSASTAMSAPGKSRRITCRSVPTSTSRRTDTTRAKPLGRAFGEGAISRGGSIPAPSIPAPLHPVLEHLQRHRTIVVGCTGERAVVAILDPGLVGAGVLAGERQPHQATRALRRDAVAVEQHLAEH